MKQQLESYFKFNNMLSPSQFDFRKGLSTVKAVDSVVFLILDGFEAKHNICATLLDLNKAFEKIFHEIPIEKLHYYGVKGVELSCLYESYQMVKVDLRLVTGGVPQGSVLRPFLFIVYINDLPNFLSAKCVHYADDSTFITVDKYLKIILQLNMRNMDRSEIWFETNNQSRLKNIWLS